MKGPFFIIKVSHAEYCKLDRDCFPVRTSLMYMAQKFLTREAAENAIPTYKEWTRYYGPAWNRYMFNHAEVIEYAG